MKRLLLILTLFCLASTSWAEKISREQALRQAQQFLNQNGKGAALTMAETSMLKARRRGQQVSDYYYVFNAGKNQGYVVVSGDDRTAPILSVAASMSTRFLAIWPLGCRAMPIRLSIFRSILRLR